MDISSSSSDEVEEVMTAVLIADYLCEEIEEPEEPEEPDRTRSTNKKQTGREYLENLLAGSQADFHDIFRMNQDCFMTLCAFLRERNLCEGTAESSSHKRVTFEESVAIFLFIVGHSARMRLVRAAFNHSTQTIQKHFSIVLNGMARAATLLIKPPDYTTVHHRISGSEDFYPWFQGAIGAADGTLIKATVPASRTNACRSRKGIVSQNVLAACDFDMMFTFVYPGWEGSANDSRVMHTALAQKLLPIPPNERYYLVDCGYTNMPGFLAPYRGEPYHLQDYQGANHAPTHSRQLFNKQHARLRNVIERTFGVFKKRFTIFENMPNYYYTRQVLMVTSCCALHNFICLHSRNDPFLVELGGETIVDHQHTEDAASTSQDLDLSSSQLRHMNNKRDEIALAMWNAIQ